MKLKQPNHYNFFGIRKFKFPPPHLEYITLSTAYNLEKTIERWINSNLKGRYYLGKTVDVDKEGKINARMLKIGFEESKELSFFTLACPHLKYH